MLARVWGIILQHQHCRGRLGQTFAVNKEGLTNGCNDSFGFEWLCDEICWFRSPTSEEPLGKCRDKDHGDIHRRQYVTDRVYTARSICQTDIGEHQFRPRLFRKGNGFDAKIIRRVVAIRKQDAAKRSEEEELLDLYLSAVGFDSTPLGRGSV